MWYPSEAMKRHSHLGKYRQWVNKRYRLKIKDYKTLWQWSVEDIDRFWSTLIEYFDLDYTGNISKPHSGSMPAVKWFEGIYLNYAEHLFRNKRDADPGIFWRNELGHERILNWGKIRQETTRLQQYLLHLGVKKGDRVGAYLPNIPEATIGFMATTSIGAIWSSCSPDFGSDSVIDRLAQIEPKVLLVADGYTYSGKRYDKMEVIREIVERIPSIQNVILIPFLNDTPILPDERYITWKDMPKGSSDNLAFEKVPFDHPIWVLYSSGTTGKPKAITHGHGGVLLEHMKYLAFHNDVKEGENFFWFSTTGWMMWNFVNAAPLVGGRIVLYEGNPGYPDLNILWKYSSDLPIHHFGTSAPFIVACMKRGVNPGKHFDLSAMRSIGSTGAPLPPEAFRYVLQEIKEEVWLCSMSGGTDVCTAFVGGCPDRPVYEGEIQCRALGCDLDAWDIEGHAIRGEVGEMVIRQPMPSMPVFFWGDTERKRYLESYFSMYPGVWRHGDWIEITPRDTIIIYGRSDATLNRHGVRIGTAEIYNVVDKFEEIQDSIVVNLELDGGRHYMPLYIVLSGEHKLDDKLREKIKNALRRTYTPRHVPDNIIACPGIPRTISGKRMEAPVKRILLGMPIEKSINIGAMKNPETVSFFIKEAEKIK